MCARVCFITQKQDIISVNCIYSVCCECFESGGFLFRNLSKKRRDRYKGRGKQQKVIFERLRKEK